MSLTILLRVFKGFGLVSQTAVADCSDIGRCGYWLMGISWAVDQGHKFSTVLCSRQIAWSRKCFSWNIISWVGISLFDPVQKCYGKLWKKKNIWGVTSLSFLELTDQSVNGQSSQYFATECESGLRKIVFWQNFLGASCQLIAMQHLWFPVRVSFVHRDVGLGKWRFRVCVGAVGGRAGLERRGREQQ